MRGAVYDTAEVRTALNPDVYTDDAAHNGNTIDMMDGRAQSVLFILATGVITGTTDPSWAVTLEVSSDGTTFEDAASGDLVGDLPTLTDADAETTHVIGYSGASRYVRLVVTAAASATDTAFLAAIAIMGGVTRRAVTHAEYAAS